MRPDPELTLTAAKALMVAVAGEPDEGQTIDPDAVWADALEDDRADALDVAARVLAAIGEHGHAIRVELGELRAKLAATAAECEKYGQAYADAARWIRADLGQNMPAGAASSSTGDEPAAGDHPATPDPLAGLQAALAETIEVLWPAGGPPRVPHQHATELPLAVAWLLNTRAALQDVLDKAEAANATLNDRLGKNHNVFLELIRLLDVREGRTYLDLPELVANLKADLLAKVSHAEGSA